MLSDVLLVVSFGLFRTDPFIVDKINDADRKAYSVFLIVLI